MLRGPRRFLLSLSLVPPAGRRFRPLLCLLRGSNSTAAGVCPGISASPPPPAVAAVPMFRGAGAPPHHPPAPTGRPFPGQRACTPGDLRVPGADLQSSEVRAVFTCPTELPRPRRKNSKSMQTLSLFLEFYYL